MNYTQGQTQTVYVKNDNVLRIYGLRRLEGSGFDNAAVVTVTIKDKTGTEVTGLPMPLSFDYVDGSNGDYQCILSKQLEWELNEPYIAEVTALSSGLTAVWEMRLTARKRPITN